MCKMHKFGGIAQLGERLNGIQEVSGSIPLISTKKGRKNGLFSHENKPFALKKFKIIFPAWGHISNDDRCTSVFTGARMAPPLKPNRNGRYLHFRAIQVSP